MTELTRTMRQALAYLAESDAKLGGPCYVTTSTQPPIGPLGHRGGVAGPLRATVHHQVARKLVELGLAEYRHGTLQVALTDEGRKAAP